MNKTNRNKEYWLIPKRANLHQSVMVIKGLIDLNYDGKTWNTSKQDRLGSYLGRHGSTNNGRTITPQALRTLVASIPQFFGFLFIDRTTTPSSIKVTEVGKLLIKEFNEFIQNYDYENLREAEKNDGEIKFSNHYNSQFLKLQITNPVIQKDCENIFVFPFSFTTRIILELGYVTMEEMAYFIFNSKDQSEIKLTILEINDFRKLEHNQKELRIDTFKITEIGIKALVKAPTTAYFKKLLTYTGYFSEFNKIDPNPNNIKQKKTKAIRIKNKAKESELELILKDLPENPYDFKDDLNLYIKYFGNPNINTVPINLEIINNLNIDIYVQIINDNSIIFRKIFNKKESSQFPFIEESKYEIQIYDLNKYKLVKTLHHVEKKDLIIDTKMIKYSKVQINIDYKLEIINHINSRNFSDTYLQRLNFLEKVTGKKFTENSNLRGAMLEYLFYKYLNSFRERNFIDDVLWMGKLNEFNHPTPAPGGPHGKPDLLLHIGDYILVIEVTTIKPKTAQWIAEGSSVPDHIRIVKNENPHNHIVAFYLAPLIHDRNTRAMESNLTDLDVKLKCLEISNIMTAFEKIKSRNDFLELLKSI